MRLKERIGDFRVRELLAEDYLQERGEFRVYRVTKRKLTTHEAVGMLADALGLSRGDVSIAGMKDRQAITVQYMSVPRGRKLRIRERELLIEAVGFAREPLRSEHSRGNAFEVTARDLRADELRALRRNLPVVRDRGLVNYFDDQRFGNLRHGEGWIARDLMQGRAEEALRSLLTSSSRHDDPTRARFKERLRACWDDPRACRDVAGRFGQHHSIFEHLAKNPGDFAGAFRYVASRLRLIHLFAYQSHVWNRALVDLCRDEIPLPQRVVLESEEGLLITYPDEVPPALAEDRSLRLPGEGCQDVGEPAWLERIEEVLARERMVASAFRIEGVPGFQLKGEDRRAVVIPAHLRVRPAEADPLHRGSRMVRLRFELPRGSYATLVVKRLFAREQGEVARGGQRRSARGRSGHGRGSGRPAGRGGAEQPGRRGAQGARGGRARRGGGEEGGRRRQGARR